VIPVKRYRVTVRDEGQVRVGSPRFVADDVKAMYCPFVLRKGSTLAPLASAPCDLTLTREVLPVTMSCRKTSG